MMPNDEAKLHSLTCRATRSNGDPFAEPWNALRSSHGSASPTSQPENRLPSSPQLEVPPRSTISYSTGSCPSKLHHSRRGSASSASPIESDRRTVITVDDPLSESDSYDAKELDGSTPHLSQWESKGHSSEGLHAEVGAWADGDIKSVHTSAKRPQGGNSRSTDASVSDTERSNERSTIEEIRKKLRSGSEFSRHKNTKRFIPYDKLRDTLTESCVRSILLQTPAFEGTPPEVIDITAHTICVVSQINGHRTSYIRIFAILVSMGQVKYIQDFLNEPIADADLPLRLSSKEQWESNLVMKSSDEDDEPPLRCFEHWDPEDMDRFLERQDKFTSPRLRMRGDRLCLHRLPSNMILPFVECNDTHIGGFGTVSKVKIHPAHCDFDASTLPHFRSWYGDRTELHQANCGDHEFALKEIHSGDYKAFRAEVGVHERFSASRQGHEHLIRLLAAIEHGTSYYLLFPWAQGTLVDLWQRFRASPESANEIEWMVKQCLGITDGLKRIHSYKSSWKRDDEDRERSLSKNTGTHGDVKAENILFFHPPNDGTISGSKQHLVVSDFGLTRFREKSLASDPLGWSVTYRAPELDMQLGTSRKYDIWSLGCLFLEFISWFLRGFGATRPQTNQRGISLITFQDVRIQDDVPYGPYKEDKFFNLKQGPGIGNTHAVVKISVLEVCCTHHGN